jgi:hypothetical protein
MEAGNRPELSVVLTVVDGEPALTRSLLALRDQIDAPTLEIIVPYDDTIADVPALASRFPEVRFVDLGSLHPKGLVLNAYTQHAIYDRRRAGGLRAANGRLVAMLEDRGRPQPNWARAMVALHEETPCAAIGGAIENGAQGSVRWALFFCDFGRFEPPLDISEPEYLTDINLCYDREALNGVRDLWEDRYFESQVNWALRRRDLRLRLSDRALVVLERRKIRLGSVMNERIQWGRIFGQVRGKETTPIRCLLWATVAPALPLVLFVRHFRRQLAKRRNVPEFVKAIPATLLLLHCWVLGEFIGYCEAARMPRTSAAKELRDDST